MGFVAWLAIYFVVWWVTLFAVLPFGVRSQEEAGDEIEPGSMPGAPSRPLMLRKVIATTVVAALVTGCVYWVITFSGLTLDDIPIPVGFTSESYS
ncbi:DUF1467 family protein [Breoghania sp.]|uniref:DUF1467 family protein n=1 Tax=Breoghania sp. TaxID=2065378 RepID=UPI0026380B2C|nr:DUF1467 family protein [Breoghania sp.]MDJ0929693.1 DUF1467 family protein [Breoghania sp.]